MTKCKHILCIVRPLLVFKWLGHAYYLYIHIQRFVRFAKACPFFHFFFRELIRTGAVLPTSVVQKYPPEQSHCLPHFIANSWVIIPHYHAQQDVNSVEKAEGPPQNGLASFLSISWRWSACAACRKTAGFISDEGNQKLMQLHYPSNSRHWH